MHNMHFAKGLPISPIQNCAQNIRFFFTSLVPQDPKRYPFHHPNPIEKFNAEIFEFISSIRQVCPLQEINGSSSQTSPLLANALDIRAPWETNIISSSFHLWKRMQSRFFSLSQAPLLIIQRFARSSPMPCTFLKMVVSLT